MPGIEGIEKIVDEKERDAFPPGARSSDLITSLGLLVYGCVYSSVRVRIRGKPISDSY